MPRAASQFVRPPEPTSASSPCAGGSGLGFRRPSPLPSPTPPTSVGFPDRCVHIPRQGLTAQLRAPALGAAEGKPRVLPRAASRGVEPECRRATPAPARRHRGSLQGFSDRPGSRPAGPGWLAPRPASWPWGKGREEGADGSNYAPTLPRPQSEAGRSASGLRWPRGGVPSPQTRRGGEGHSGGHRMDIQASREKGLSVRWGHFLFQGLGQRVPWERPPSPLPL